MSLSSFPASSARSAGGLTGGERRKPGDEPKCGASADSLFPGQARNALSTTRRSCERSWPTSPALADIPRRISIRRKTRPSSRLKGRHVAGKPPAGVFEAWLGLGGWVFGNGHTRGSPEITLARKRLPRGGASPGGAQRTGPSPSPSAAYSFRGRSPALPRSAFGGRGQGRSFRKSWPGRPSLRGRSVL